jgi:glycerol-3-phosphate acyltransferase PlsY
VAVFDMAKGAIPVLVFGPRAGSGQLTPLLLGATAMLGHVFSVFVGFRGGKGVATGAGVVLGIAPWAFLVAFLVWAILVRATGYVSLGSVVAAVALPPAVYLLHPDRRPLIWVFAAIAALVVVMHRANLKRLLAGTESRFGKGAPAA